MIPQYKLGKKAARADAVRLKLVNYIDRRELPKAPSAFGHERLIPASGWFMLGNDEFGCCVWSGAAHEHMLWHAEGRTSVAFSTASVLSDYSAVTGFDPRNPNSDQGTDMGQAASYRRHVGILDAKGNRHKVAAYLSLRPGNLDDLFVAVYLFGAVGIGIEVPSSAMDQFNTYRPWSVVRNSRIEGGHYVPLVAKRGNLVCVTWGRTQAMTPEFYRKYNDETVAYVSDDVLRAGKSPEGFDWAQLNADLETLRSAA